jgi:hypothetical protein
MGFQESMIKEFGDNVLYEDDCEPLMTHTVHRGIYAREISMLKDMLVVGKIHKYSHINILAYGEVTVASEFHTERFQAPRVWVSEPGIKRIVYNHTDVKWITIHNAPDGVTDADELLDSIVAKTYEDFDLFTERNNLLKILFDNESTVGGTK